MSGYDWLRKINKIDFKDITVLVIGAGDMAEQYSHALSRMKMSNVTILSKSEPKALRLCKKFNFKQLTGGFEKHLPYLEQFDLVIIATPVDLLSSAAELAIESGQRNILIEKPVSVYYQEIERILNSISGQKVRVGYNRVAYPNFHKLKEITKEDGGITSCRYSFTEWIHRIDFSTYTTEVLRYWGTANSLHVISMAHELIDMPKEIIAHQHEQFKWHPSGAIFYGAGLTHKNIPFSYHSDWKAPGRWNIEIMTQENTYRLMPLEELYKCHKNSVEWEEIPFQVSYPDVKPGVAEEIAIMLDESTNKKLDLITLEKAIDYCKLAEIIFGYERKKY